MPANGDERQPININKVKPIETAPDASEPSTGDKKKEEYENLPPNNAATKKDREERGPIKDRSCTDVLCLGKTLDFVTNSQNFHLPLFFSQDYSLPSLSCGQVM